MKKRVSQAISDQNSALTLQPHRSMRSTFLSLSLGFPTITYHETVGSTFATESVSRVAVMHEAHRIGLLLQPLGVGRREILDSRPFLHPITLPADANPVLNKLAEAGKQKLVGIAPGSVWGTKRWLPKYFAQLVDQVSENAGTTVVLLGSPDECGLVDEILTMVKDKSVVNLSGKTRLSDLAWLYPRLSLLVSNDSSPTHFGSAFNVPTVTLFGATVHQMGFGPLASKSRSLGIDLECRPCSDHGPKTCPLGHFRCMTDLQVPSVYKHCQDMLEP